MLKRLLIVVSLMLFSFIPIISPVTVSAAPSEPSLIGNEGGTATNSLACGNPLMDKEDIAERVNDEKSKASLADEFIIDAILNVTGIDNINSLSTLVYGNPYCVWSDDTEMAADGVFTVNERTKIIDPVFKMLGVIYATLITLAIMISTLKMGFKAHSPQGRADFWQDLMYWVLSALFLATFTQSTDILFALNMGIVDTFGGLIESAGLEKDGASIISSADEKLTLSDIFTFFGEWILALIVNFIYISRKIVILLLMIMGVVAGVSLLFAKTRYFFGVWLKELIGNIFIQSIHAIILYSFVMMAHTGAGVIMKMGMLIMFIPLTGMVSKWLNLGDSSSKLGNTLAMTGMAGVGGALMLSRQAGGVMRGRGQGSEKLGQGDSLKPSSTQIGGGSDGSITSISTKGAGIDNKGFQSFKSIAGKTGAVVGGVAGSVAGPAGVMVGSKIGSMAGRGIAQGGHNIAGAAGGLIHTTKDGIKNANSRSDLEHRRAVMGGVGESFGTLFSTGGTKQGAIGRKIGQSLSGVSQRRLSETPSHLGGVATASGIPMNMDTLMKDYDGKDLAHVQTVDSSYVAEKNKDGSIGTRLTPLGAGNPSLERGETVYKDFKVGQPPLEGDYNSITNKDSVRKGGPGSTENIQATSGFYKLDDQGNKVADARHNPNSVNVDSYFSHSSVKGSERPMTERVADAGHSTATKVKQGAKNAGIGFKMAKQDMQKTAAWQQNIERSREEHVGKRRIL